MSIPTLAERPGTQVVMGPPPKYDLYGDPTMWHDNIQETRNGAWYRAKDIDPLLAQLVRLGGTATIALYPTGEAWGVRRDTDASGQPRPTHTGAGKLPDFEHPSLDNPPEELRGDGAGHRDIGDGETGILSEDGESLRDGETD